jgi:predicted kinase
MKAFVLVGIPGAGKSTYAKKLAQIENAVIICGDDIRTELETSGVSDPCWVEIWDFVEEKVAEAAECGRNVILDGTHVGASHRAEIRMLLHSYGYFDVEAIILDLPLAVCTERNSNRKRKVADYVISHMFKTLQESLPTLHSEPFSHFNFVY